ncbi:putative zinc protease [Sideroxyarcus emersonii]|uniref:Zinc protease n=1 Tax=Sideroxyarcus emersonii TaxID=2764705 RepID=A0AAN1XBK4_9PROT|nr:pitrilysin family protein [Sideroxyarcus emersonii]BCK88294.1 putative zinc protease [Sideroxyarcus emersonii]
MRIQSIVVALVFLAVPVAQAEVYEKTLDNGLKVIVKEDHRAPVLVQQVWYHVGSMDERTGTTGVAHVLEHMMFKGTRDVPVGQFSKIIAAAGGRENAFTSYDHTAYFQQLHKSRLPLAMKLESDRMHNLQMAKKEFDKEIKVVMEERRWRTDDEPHSLVYEKMMATAFQEHPYHNPVIGWMVDLQNMTDADALNWYKTWYAPNDATLVIAGDVKAQEVFALAQRYYGSIPAVKLPQRKAVGEAPQLGIQRIVVKAPAELPYLIMAWHAPTLRDAEKDWKPYALEVLAGVLDGNSSARLNKALVRDQQVAMDVGTGYESVARGPGLFVLEGTPREGKTVADVENALREQLALLVRDGVSAEELRRVKAQVMAGEVYKRDSVFYQAMQIGQMETAGLSYKDIPVMLLRLQAVTAQQVQDVAREIFNDDHLTVATLDPQPLSDKPRHNPAGAAHAH